MNVTLVFLLISLIAAIFLIFKISKSSNKNLMIKYFNNLVILLVIYLVALILQILCSNIPIKPIYFDYIAYAAGIFVAIMFFAISQAYSGKNKINIKYLCVIPIILLIVLWTSDWHQLFYIKYSTIMTEMNMDHVFIYILYIHMD